MAFPISFSAPMIFSAVKKRPLNTICSGVDPEAHSSKIRAPLVQLADMETIPVLTVSDTFSFSCWPEPFASADGVKSNLQSYILAAVAVG